jgi:hypothetical protein
VNRETKDYLAAVAFLVGMLLVVSRSALFIGISFLIGALCYFWAQRNEAKKEDQ